MKACRSVSKLNLFKHGRGINDELRENLEFVFPELKAQWVAALASLAATIFAALTAVAVGFAIFAGFSIWAPLLLAPIPPLAYVVVGWYPSWRARQERTRALGDAPTLVSYLAMAMKVTPNLERASSFAGEQLGGRMGRDLRETISESYLRVHSSADEALSKFAGKWGKWCPELKRSIYLIRSSVNERGEASRMYSLNRALEHTLDGARERFREFAADIRVPMFVIYSIGVLLPLILVAILPVLSVINLHVGIAQVSVIYCVVLPLVVYTLSRGVLSKRPASTKPPEVPLKRVRWGTVVLVVALSLPLPALSFWFGAPPDVKSLALLWGPTLSVTAYLHLTSARAFKRRVEIEGMEGEFCDALVQLGNRISEGRPAEDALEHAAETMRGGKLADILARASANVRLGGLGLRSAMFDEERGALLGVPSHTIRGTLRMLVDLIERSTRAAGDAILKVADHLRELKGLKQEIRHSMEEITSSMRSVALFFAPLVVSIAARMQGLLASKTGSVGFLGSGSGVSSAAFLLVLGVYVLLLTVILMCCAVEIELGDDRLIKRVVLARGLPVTLGVFTAGAILGGQMLNTLIS